MWTPHINTYNVINLGKFQNYFTPNTPFIDLFLLTGKKDDCVIPPNNSSFSLLLTSTYNSFSYANRR